MGTGLNRGVVASCVLLALLTRPVARVVSEGYATFSAFPLTATDLALVRPTSSGTTETGLVSVSSLDPWGRPFRFERSPSLVRVYSTGPNGRDEGGTGDDVVVAFQPIYDGITWSPALFGGAAVLWAWACAAVRLGRAPRSRVLWKELLRAAAMASLPSTVGIALLVFFGSGTLPAVPLTKASALSPVIPPAGSIAFVSLLVALWFRFRPGRAVEDEESPPRPPVRRRRIALILLALALVGVAAARLVPPRVASWQRERLLASARLGVQGAIDEVLGGSDLELVRAFASQPPRGFSFSDGNDARLDALAPIGSEALPVTLEALTRTGATSIDINYRTVPWRNLQSWDPEYAELSRQAAARPGDFAGLLLTTPRSFVETLGRERTLRLLAPLLEDRRPTGQKPCTRRVCDVAAGEISMIVYGQLDFELPVPSIVDKTTWPPLDERALERWDAAVMRVRDWWSRERPDPKLLPAGWISVHAKGMGPKGSLYVEVQPHYSLDWRNEAPAGPDVTWRFGPYTPGRRTLIVSTSAKGGPFSIEVSVRAGETVAVFADFAAGTITSSPGSPPPR